MGDGEPGRITAEVFIVSAIGKVRWRRLLPPGRSCGTRRSGSVLAWNPGAEPSFASSLSNPAAARLEPSDLQSRSVRSASVCLAYSGRGSGRRSSIQVLEVGIVYLRV